MLTQFAAAVALLLALAAGQATGTLRVRVVLADAAGLATPIPRLTILVSDNPPTDEPRRARTAADGSIELKLPPGSYTVELDEPVGFRGKAYTWTQIVEVAAGRETLLDLTAGNADEVERARISADSAALLTAWRDSVVEIWSPTRHASGFVIDATKGLIATSHHALGDVTAVEVQLTSGKDRVKVPGTVLVSARDPGAAIVWINPAILASTRGFDLGCAAAARPAVAYKDVVTTITASMFANKEVSDGMVTRPTMQGIFSTLRIGGDSEGGPVFTGSGELLGISAIEDDREDRRRWNDAWIVPAERACQLVTIAIARTATAAAPPATRLPLEPQAPVLRTVTGPAAGFAPKRAKVALPTVKSSDFDITLMTPRHARDIEPGILGLRADFGTWHDYIRDADRVVLVRISPQFEEAMWKSLARGYAALNGVWLSPFKSFTANFLRMRAYCGAAEVTPIHPFIIEHLIPERSPIREGLYVFEQGAFGPHCQSIRFSMFSEKDPQGADTKVIDPKLFAQLIDP
jgi:hypothetical protein